MKVLKRKDYPMHEHILFKIEKHRTYIHSICVCSFLNRVDIHLFLVC